MKQNSFLILITLLTIFTFGMTISSMYNDYLNEKDNKMNLLGKCFFRYNNPGKVISVSKTHALLYFKKTSYNDYNFGFRSYKRLEKGYKEVPCGNIIFEDEFNITKDTIQ